MKRLFAALLALTICCLLFHPARAQATSRADVRLDLTPVQGENDELFLEVGLTVANGQAEEFISNVELVYDNHTIASIPECYGSSDLFFRTDALGPSFSTTYNEFTVTLYYIDFDGSAMENYYPVAISGHYAAPSLRFSRTASAIDAQNHVTLTYTLENDGRIPLSNLTISDPADPDGEVAYLDLLDVGRSRSFTLDLTLSRETRSAPEVRYTAPGLSGTQLTALEPITLSPSLPSLVLTVKSDLSSISAGETATLTLSVSNSGGTDFPSVTISEESLGVIAENVAMEVGKVNTYTKVVNPAQTTRYRFTATAKDAAGNNYSAFSDYLTLEVLPAAVTDPNQLLQLEVSTPSTTLEVPGEVALSFVVRNLSQGPLSQLTISDGKGNVLTRSASMEPGTATFDLTIAVPESAAYSFLAEALLTDGTPVQSASAPLEIHVLQTGLIPSPGDSEPTTLPVNSGSGLSPWLLVLFIFLILLIIACIVVLVMLQLRARRRRAARDDDDDFVTSYTQDEYEDREGYDYEYSPASDEDARAEISRFASQYSPRRSAVQRPPQEPVYRPQEPAYRPEPEEDDEPTVYHAPHDRRPPVRREPRTREDYHPRS